MSEVDRQDIIVKFVALDNVVLDKTVKHVTSSIKRVGGSYSGPIFLPNQIKKITLNTSPHVSKASQEQFEVGTHKRLVVIRQASSDVVDSLSGLELSPGIDVNVNILLDKSSSNNSSSSGGSAAANGSSSSGGSSSSTASAAKKKKKKVKDEEES